MDNIIANVASRVSPTVQTAPKAPGALGKEDFLRLLVAQMEKQDPLNPQDATEFTAQLAQFSSLEQLININQGMRGLDTLGALNMMSMATGTIGKVAQVSGDRLTLVNGVATRVKVDLSRDSKITKMNIYDADGKLISVQDLGNRAGGTHEVQWNGLDNKGNPVPDGVYYFDFITADAAGEAVPYATEFKGIVTGVRFENGTTMLDIGGASYSMAEISGFRQP